MKEFLDTQKKLIGIILVTSILFARCNLGITYSKWFVLINLLVNGLTFAYCLWLGINDKATIKKALLNPAVAWILFFSAIVIVYGHFHIRFGAPYYSRQITVLTVVPAILLLILFFYLKDDVLDVMSISGSVVIITTLITSLLYDKVWADWLKGQYYRVGETPAGGDIDTGNLILMLLIPILYQIIINKKIKGYFLFAVVGLFQILAAGSKSSVLPLVLVIAIMLIGSAKDKKTIRRNVIIVIVLGILAFVAVMLVPALYSVIGKRLVEMFVQTSATEIDLKTSTGQRLAQIAAFKEHFGEYPIFGHGFYAFKEMPYSALEAVRLNDEATEFMYQHLQLHMNYMEILFSYGIFGFIAYYWFPIYILIKTVRTNRQTIILVASIMTSMFFMDLGLDMYYRYLVPYMAYFLAYYLIVNGKQNEQ
ncbi:MAG: O-antigen ligase family protein [Pseudobutyrivibrio sp.]|nr:O-antigen ligase family protein [Pseudobutyrivibrio sp.]